MSAYSADRWIKAQRTIETRPYGQYVTAGDERVRPEHAALDGVVKPLSDPFWSRHTPPWDYNCRCTWVTVSPDEMEVEGLTETSDEAVAARYQAQLMLQGTEPTPQMVRSAAQNLLPVMRRKDSVSEFLPPAKAQWTFDRSDAYGLLAEGWEPATEQGRSALDTVLSLPRIEDLI
ncbi:MAG: phage minor head protein [Planctomycetota bacterium]